MGVVILIIKCNKILNKKKGFEAEKKRQQTWSVDWVRSRKLSLELGPDELHVPVVVGQEEGGGESVPLLANTNVHILAAKIG